VCVWCVCAVVVGRCAVCVCGKGCGVCVCVRVQGSVCAVRVCVAGAVCAAQKQSFLNNTKLTTVPGAAVQNMSTTVEQVRRGVGCGNCNNNVRGTVPGECRVGP